MGDSEKDNSRKRAAPENDEPKDGPTVKHEDEEEDKTTSEPDVQRRRVDPSTSSTSSSSTSYEYDMKWDQFAEFGSGNDVTLFTGASDAQGLCDEKVDPVLVSVGRRLLDALSPTTGDEPKPEEGDGEDEEDGGDEKSEVKVAPELLTPLNVIVGQWREDEEAGKQRAKIVGEVAEPLSVRRDAGPSARVYRADGTPSKAGSSDEKPQKDRFELTFLDWGEERQYIFVLDKVERRFVFVGEDGSHPHCGTNDFVYDNSDGSGPGLFGVSPAPPPTPEILLAAARKRFIQYCLDQDH